MKFSSLAVVAALTAPTAAEIYLKEQFNDKVRFLLVVGRRNDDLATVL